MSGHHQEHEQQRQTACGHEAASRTHLLLAGLGEDVSVLRQLVRNAPASSYGQVFVEVDAADLDPGSRIDPGAAAGVHGWDLPEGMSLTVLRRDLAPAAAARRRRGRLLSAAVSAWADEWLAGDTSEPGASGPGFVEPGETSSFAMWVGAATSPDVDLLCHRLARRFDSVPAHLHRP